MLLGDKEILFKNSPHATVIYDEISSNNSLCTTVTYNELNIARKLAMCRK